MYRLCSEAEEMDHDHIQRCRSLTDAMDSVSNLDSVEIVKTIFDCKKENGVRHLNWSRIKKTYQKPVFCLPVCKLI